MIVIFFVLFVYFRRFYFCILTFYTFDKLYCNLQESCTLCVLSLCFQFRMSLPLFAAQWWCFYQWSPLNFGFSVLSLGTSLAFSWRFCSIAFMSTNTTPRRPSNCRALKHSKKTWGLHSVSVRSSWSDARSNRRFSKWSPSSFFKAKPLCRTLRFGCQSTRSSFRVSRFILFLKV